MWGTSFPPHHTPRSTAYTYRQEKIDRQYRTASMCRGTGSTAGVLIVPQYLCRPRSSPDRAYRPLSHTLFFARTYRADLCVRCISHGRAQVLTSKSGASINSIHQRYSRASSYPDAPALRSAGSPACSDHDGDAGRAAPVTSNTAALATIPSQRPLRAQIRKLR